MQADEINNTQNFSNLNNSHQDNLPPLSALDQGLKQKLLWQNTSCKVLKDGTLVKTHIPVYRGNPFSRYDS